MKMIWYFCTKKVRFACTEHEIVETKLCFGIFVLFEIVFIIQTRKFNIK